MKKQFIPYELALELKELGFDEPCLGGYDKTKKWWYHPDSDIILDTPFWQQAFDWFREKHKLNSFIYNPIDKINYCFEIKNISEFINDGDLSEMQSEIKYTYEEARLECLKKLINIIK